MRSAAILMASAILVAALSLSTAILVVGARLGTPGNSVYFIAAAAAFLSAGLLAAASVLQSRR